MRCVSTIGVNLAIRSSWMEFLKGFIDISVG